MKANENQISLIEKLKDPVVWEEFLIHKIGAGNLSQAEERDLLSFIDRREFLHVLDDLNNGNGWGVPSQKLISKMGSDKKRTVYVFPRAQQYVLKLLTFLLIRRYDHLMAPNLYSFRANRGVQAAMRRLKRLPSIDNYYVYKLDIHDYFNSVDVSQMLAILNETLADDPCTLEAIKSLITNPKVEVNGQLTEVRQKGIMAGTPVSTFLANLYLCEMDWEFFNLKDVVYMRYADDIIVFSVSVERRECCKALLYDYLQRKGLEINPKKEMLANPRDPWVFLGIGFNEGKYDVAPAAAQKLCAKMKRNSRKLVRAQEMKGFSAEKAVRSFIRRFNNKLFERLGDNDLTWTHWYFPLIDTTETIKRIDRYMQDCIRYIALRRHNNSRFQMTYEKMKEWGYRSMTNEYYTYKKLKKVESNG